jgi:hypothetical protein
VNLRCLRSLPVRCKSFNLRFQAGSNPTLSARFYSTYITTNHLKSPTAIGSTRSDLSRLLRLYIGTGLICEEVECRLPGAGCWAISAGYEPTRESSSRCPAGSTIQKGHSPSVAPRSVQRTRVVWKRSSHYGSDQKTAPFSIVGRLYVTPPALTFPSTGCTSPRNGRKNPRPRVAPDMATCTPVCGVWTGFTPP